MVIEPENKREKRTIAKFWPKMRRASARIPFAEDAVAAYYTVRDPQTPGRVKATLVAALAYFIMPADLIPDIIAVLGFTDDAAVLGLAIRSVSGHIREPHRDAARQALLKEAPAGEADSARAPCTEKSDKALTEGR